MSFLLFAAPIIFIIFLIIFVMVFSSDSKRYQRKLDNTKQMELDRARQSALKTVEEIRRLKQGSTPKTTDYHVHGKSKALSEQKENARKQVVSKIDVQNDVHSSTFNEYQKYYNENYNKGQNKFAKQRQFQSQTVIKRNEKKLVFSKENLVRGLIAKEYLNRKKGGRQL